MGETTVNNVSPQKGNPMIPVVIILLLLLIGGALLLMNNRSTNQAASTSQPTSKPLPSPTKVMTQETSAVTSTTPEPSATGTTSEEKVIDMEAGSYYYNPKTITVKKGQKIKINLKAVSMMHNFNIDELNVHSPTVRNGDTATFEFTADKVGSFEYFCAVANHRQLGQVGTLIVQ